MVALLIAVSLGLTLALLCVPLGAVLLQTTGILGSALWDAEVFNVLSATLQQASLSVAISGVLGLGLGLWVGQLEVRSRSVFRLLFLLPFAVPTVVAATLWVRVLHGSSLLYSFSAVVLAHVVFNVPWVAYAVSEARARVPRAQIEVAKTLGSRSWTRFSQVIWPYVRWSWFSALAQVFSLCISSFILVLILGGGPPVQTLETAIYSKLRYSGLNMSGALVFAFWQVLISLVPWGVVLWMEGKKAELQSENSGGHASRKSGRSFAGLTAALFLGALFFASQGSGSVQSAMGLSLEISAWVSVASVVWALLQATLMEVLKRWPRLQLALGVLHALPAGISILVIGMGYWFSYGSLVDPFDGSILLIVLIQVTLFTPLAFRLLWPVLRQRPLSQWEASRTLGAGLWRTWVIVEWPRWKKPIAAALGWVGALALGEVAAVTLFYSEKRVPLPLLISRLMGQYRMEEAEQVSFLLLGMAFVLTVGAWAFGERES